jgi:hypothetical protein
MNRPRKGNLDRTQRMNACLLLHSRSFHLLCSCVPASLPPTPPMHSFTHVTLPHPSVRSCLLGVSRWWRLLCAKVWHRIQLSVRDSKESAQRSTRTQQARAQSHGFHTQVCALRTLVLRPLLRPRCALQLSAGSDQYIRRGKSRSSETWHCAGSDSSCCSLCACCCAL